MIPRLIYCASGNRRFAEIAIRHGYVYGAQLPATIYYHPEFVDQDWKRPNRERYMSALREHKPALASVLDWECPEQISEVLSWADEAAQYVGEAVIIIPKVQGGVAQLPRIIRDKQVRLGYSVPTRFGGTALPYEEFRGWPVHLLGGAPHKQMKIAGFIHVESADGNYAQKIALSYAQFFAPGHSATRDRYWPKWNDVYHEIGLDAHYHAFELSCINIRAAWNGAICGIRYAAPFDVPAIKHIANFYKRELGFVNSAALLSAIARKEVYVAEYEHQMTGFVHLHLRKDGWRTIYEIATHPDWTGRKIAWSLVQALPAPIRLKCTVDNPANSFYEHVGFTMVRRELGKSRALNVYELAPDNVHYQA